MSSAQPKVLVVLTSHDRLGNTGKPTGWYLPEFAHPYEVLEPHSSIIVASPKGGEAPLDPSSVDAFKEDNICKNFMATKQSLWQKTEKLSNFIGKAQDFDAIFYVGGHGPMFDLAIDPVSQQIIREFYEADKVVAAVCHGPAAFVNVKLSDGTHLLKDKSVTSFSNAEEDAVKLSSAMPFMLETELDKASGGKYAKASEAWGEKVIVDGKIITGQNPASATGIGKAILKVISGSNV